MKKIYTFLLSLLNVKFYFLTGQDRENVKNYADHGKEQLRVWFIFSVFGSIFPILIAFGINMLLNEPNNWLYYLNNGAIPLISYSLIISALVFLLDTTEPDHEYLRKKILGVSIILIFVNVALFILLSSIGKILTWNGHVVLLIASFIFIFISIQLCSAMIVLQKPIIQDYGDTLDKKRKGVKQVYEGDDDVNFD